jgi:hypothetical protein
VSVGSRSSARIAYPGLYADLRKIADATAIQPRHRIISMADSAIRFVIVG